MATILLTVVDTASSPLNNPSDSSVITKLATSGRLDRIYIHACYMPTANNPISRVDAASLEERQKSEVRTSPRLCFARGLRMTFLKKISHPQKDRDNIR
eukprot:scaffold503368_cov19-Prasinocladus_malaysianus.AAC.2